MTSAIKKLEQAREALKQVEKCLEEERTCHDDCMCDICIAKQQTWEAQEVIIQAIAELKVEPTEFTTQYNQILDAVVVAFATNDNEIVQDNVQVAIDSGRQSCAIIETQAKQLEKGECKWTPNETNEYETYDFWDTECGGAFSVTTGTPEENKMKFCPYCGKILKQVIGE